MIDSSATNSSSTERRSVLRSARQANSIAFAGQGLFLAVVLTELPQLKDKFDLSEAALVGAVAGISLIAALGSVAAERVAVRWSSRTALRLGLCLVAISGLAIACSPVPAALFVALAIYGIGLGAVDAGTNMQAVLIQHGQGRFILSSFYAAWSAGAIAGALFVAACAALDLSVSVAIGVAAVAVLLAGQTLGPRLLGAADAESGPDEHDPARPVPVGTFLMFGVTLALAFAIDLAVGNWSALYLSEELHASAAASALALAAYQGASLAGRLAGDTGVRRWGSRTVSRCAAAIGSVGLAIVVVAPTSAIAIIGFLVAGIGLPLIAPLCFSELGRRTGGRGLDALIARLNLFNYAGTLVGGVVVGSVATAANLRAGFAIPLLFALALFGLARIFSQRLRHSSATATIPGQN
ncbi:MFS transporter [Nocardia sp. bgisy134]|uniref:MFS transporter n=1 Tax=Nocardia sp. bgisy134 TaxID=3413789 RepID=UPI003D75894E